MHMQVERTRCLAFVPAPDPEISAAAAAAAALDAADSWAEDGSSLNSAIFVWKSKRASLSPSDSAGLV